MRETQNDGPRREYRQEGDDAAACCNHHSRGDNASPARLLRPTLHRDIELESTDTLHTLAWGITRAFDFEHAFGFFSRLTGRVFASPIRYELLADAAISGAARNLHETSVARALPRLGSKMLFVYDYGDEWRFRVELISRGETAAGVAYPRVVARLGKAPEQYPGTDVS